MNMNKNQQSEVTQKDTGKYQRLGKNISMMAIGSFSSRLISFFLVPLYTSILSTEDYGISDLIFTSTALAIPLFTLVIYEAMMRFALREGANHQDVFTSGIFVTGIGIVFVTALSPLILLYQPLQSYYLYFLLYYYTHVLFQTATYFARGIDQVSANVIGGIVNTVVTIALNILLLAVFNFGIRGYLVSYIAGQFIAMVVVVLKSKSYRYFRWPLRIEKNTLKEMINYSLPLIPNSISWWLSKSAGKYVITSVIGASGNGLYAVAYKVPSILSTITEIFTQAWKISSVEEFGSEASKRFYKNTYSMYFSTSIVLAVVVSAFSKVIAHILFKGDYFQAWLLVPPLVLASLFHGLSGFFGTIFTSAMKTKDIFTTTLVGGVINVALCVFLVPKLNVIGACISIMCANAAIYVIRLVRSRKFLRFDIQFANHIIQMLLIITEIIAICVFENWFVVVAITLVICVMNIKNLTSMCGVITKLITKKARGNDDG